MSPAASVVGAENLCLLLVHLQILGEDGLSGEDPSPTPVPPFLYGPAGVLAHGGDGLGPLQGPSGGGGGDGLELEREGGQPPPERRRLIRVRAPGDGEGLAGGGHCGDSLLKALNNGGHGWL